MANRIDHDLIGRRCIARCTKPSRRHAKNLTAFERATACRYSIVVTNIPAAGGIPGVLGSHHAQFTDVLHREHAIVEDQVRTNKAMGLQNLPLKAWVVNCGWVLAANIAADLSAWCHLLGLYNQDDLKDAEPGTLRPAVGADRPPGPPRPCSRAEDQPDPAVESDVPGLLAAAMRPARTCLTSHSVPATRKGARPGAVGAEAAPSTSGAATPPSGPANQTPQPKTGTIR